jgi:hypothetical protein
MTDRLLNWMKSHDVPITREAYIQLAWGNDPPDPWMPEHEAELPEELQDIVEDQLSYDNQLDLFDYDPNQPRDPSGSPTGGQWTSSHQTETNQFQHVGRADLKAQGFNPKRRGHGESQHEAALVAWHHAQQTKEAATAVITPRGWTILRPGENVSLAQPHMVVTPEGELHAYNPRSITDPSPAPMFTQQGNEILRGGEVVASMRTMTEGRVELTINGRRQKFRNYQAALSHLAQQQQHTEASGGEDKMLLVTHNPSHEQFDKWEIQVQERQDELEKQGQVGGDEDDQLQRMKTALKEFRESKLEDRDSGKIGFSAVYGGPHDAVETRLLAATLVRYSDQQKVARITLSGGTDRDAHTKSLQMIVAGYGNKATRIEGAIWGSDIESALRYENAGFRLAGETSTGQTRLIYGDPELTEFEKQARAVAAAEAEQTRQGVVRQRAVAAATALDFDPKFVQFTDEDRQFNIGGSDKKYNYAGSYTRGDNAVKIYYKHCSTAFAASCTAHEIGHRKLDALRARVRDERQDVHNEPGPHGDPNGQYWWQKKGGHDAVMAPDGTLRAPYDKKYPFYQAWQKLSELNYNKLRDSDGVSDYSKEYWAGYLKGDVSIDSAYHETIAELSRLKFESGKLQGSKEWNALYNLMDKHWEQMTPTERELKQPSGEKAFW